jgi:Peroxiredoxin
MWCRSKRAWAWAVLASTIAGATLRAEVGVGDRFPSLQDAGLSEGVLPEVEGRVLLVDFWASWCAPCKASFPAFARLHEEFGVRGLAIVAVSVDEKRAAYAAFVKKLAPPFATVRDAGHSLASAVGVPAMPTTYLVDRAGRVRFVHRGFHGSASERELRAQIEALLAERG